MCARRDEPDDLQPPEIRQGACGADQERVWNRTDPETPGSPMRQARASCQRFRVEIRA